MEKVEFEDGPPNHLFDSFCIKDKCYLYNPNVKAKFFTAEKVCVEEGGGRLFVPENHQEIKDVAYVVNILNSAFMYV